MSDCKLIRELVNGYGTDAIIALSRSLIRIPSQTETDSPVGVLNHIGQWCIDHALEFRKVTSRGRTVGILVVVDSGIEGPSICLNAPIDTSPVGPLHLWTVSPFEGAINDGWLYGRGSGDAKTGAAIALQAALIAKHSNLIKCGRLSVLLEGDEHSGHFSCIRSLIERERTLFDFVAIVYPGNTSVRVGARGFWRGKLTFSGLMRHSGSSSPVAIESNPIFQAAEFLRRLRDVPIPEGRTTTFPLAPAITPTMVRGGGGFTHVPAAVDLNIDIRTTIEYDANWARLMLTEFMDGSNTDNESWSKLRLKVVGSWPAYILPDSEQFSTTLIASAKDVFDHEIARKISGPSNIANYLATKGIPATCGFGVAAENIHGIDERIEVSSVLNVLMTYVLAISRWNGAK